MEGKEIPSLETIKSWIPKECFEKCEITFLVSLGFSLSLTLGVAYLAHTFIPLEVMYIPIWIAYAVVNGTIATGLWVLGHECGHKAFSNNDLLNDGLGFILHTPLLVPYFSW